jgi:hypothetical protein
MAGIKMKSDYGGYEIRWNDLERKFIIFRDDLEVKEKMDCLEDCEKWIDSQNKKKFKQIPILYNFQYIGDEMEKGKAIGFSDDGLVWLVSGCNRRRAGASHVWLDTPENREILKVVKEKNEEISRLRKEVNDIKGNAKRLNIEMLLGE